MATASASGCIRSVGACSTSTRLERDGLVNEAWRATENNRRAKYYSLTARGRRTLERETREWEAQSAAIARVLRASRGEL